MLSKAMLRFSRTSAQTMPRAFAPVLFRRDGFSTDAGPPTSVHTERINRNLHFRQIVGDEESSKRPIVLLYSWLVAKSKHISKYGDYYLGKGFDVLNIKVEPQQLLIPTRAQGVAQNVIDFVTDTSQQEKPIIVHGFSVGGYLYGETMVKILDNEQYRNVGNRMIGQIFDSPVDFEGVPVGFSRAVTSQKFLQRALQKSLEVYLSTTKSFTMKHYLRASEAFKQNPYTHNALFLYSKSDLICDNATIEACIEDWKSRGIAVQAKCWDESAHVSHYHFYRDEYIMVLDRFVNSIYPRHSQDQRLQQDKEIPRKAVRDVQ